MPPCSTRAATSRISSCGARMQLAGVLVHEQRDRHAPGALARDAPVRAGRDHAVDALLAPGRDPLHALDLAQRVLAQPLLVHADEPLRRGAEDHRRLVAPAMRVAVAQRLLVQQLPVGRAAPAMMTLVGLLDLQARRPAACSARKRAVVAHRVDHRQPVLHADREVLLAVAGRGVHRAGAGIERHVLAEDHRHLALVERMLQLQAFQRAALAARRAPAPRSCRSAARTAASSSCGQR